MPLGKLPLVSIITPAYNAAQYLPATIRSVLAQTYANLEYFIIDDGSTDKTSAVVKSFSDSRIKYIHQENLGQSAARNLGISQAKGKYIAFLDADDFFLSDKILKQVNYLESHTNCDFCYCKIYHFFHSHPDKTYYFPINHPSGQVFKEILSANFINPLSVMVKKSVFEKHGGFGDSYRWIDEQFLWLKLAYHKVEFCYLNEPLGYCRLHENSFTNRQEYLLKSSEDYLKVLQEVKSWMDGGEYQKDLERVESEVRRKMFLGKLIAQKNILGRTLHSLYLFQRKLRLKHLKDNSPLLKNKAFLKND